MGTHRKQLQIPTFHLKSVTKHHHQWKKGGYKIQVPYVSDAYPLCTSCTLFFFASIYQVHAA